MPRFPLQPSQARRKCFYAFRVGIAQDSLCLPGHSQCGQGNISVALPHSIIVQSSFGFELT